MDVSQINRKCYSGVWLLVCACLWHFSFTLIYILLNLHNIFVSRLRQCHRAQARWRALCVHEQSSHGYFTDADWRHSDVCLVKTSAPTTEPASVCVDWCSDKSKDFYVGASLQIFPVETLVISTSDRRPRGLCFNSFKNGLIKLRPAGKRIFTHMYTRMIVPIIAENLLAF